MITIQTELTPEQAMALAQLAKRTGWSDTREKAVSDDDAYLMMDALNQLEKSLAEAGYATRWDDEYQYGELVILIAGVGKRDKNAVYRHRLRTTIRHRQMVCDRGVFQRYMQMGRYDKYHSEWILFCLLSLMGSAWNSEIILRLAFQA